MPSQGNSAKRIPIIIVVLLVAIIALLCFIFLRPDSVAESVGALDGTPKLGYATEGVTIVEDPDALQHAVDEMLERAKDGFALEYRGTAESTDGTIFTCYFANSLLNEQDLFINIYADAALTDQLFLSGLIKPGQAFNQIELEHPLEKGTHTVYVVHTRVNEDLESIHSQTTVTAEFTVK